MSPVDPVMIAPALAWIVAVTLASIGYRRVAGKPILFFSLDRARFLERTASGHSNDNLLRRIGGAANCLVVGIVDDRFVVRPFFPFNLLFLPEIYALEHDIPLSRIREVVLGRFLFWKQAVVSFDDERGRSRSMTLYLKDPDGLAKLLRPTRQSPVTQLRISD